MTIRTATQYIELVENRLGWESPEGPQFLRYQPEARKVTLKMTTDPELYTFRNLELAVELLAREKVTRSPVGVFAHVERALEAAREIEPDMELRIREVCDIEVKRGDPDGWVTRFARASGKYRGQALDDYETSRFEGGT